MLGDCIRQRMILEVIYGILALQFGLFFDVLNLRGGYLELAVVSKFTIFCIDSLIIVRTSLNCKTEMH